MGCSDNRYALLESGAGSFICPIASMASSEHSLTIFILDIQKVQNARSPVGHPYLSALRPFARQQLKPLRILERSVTNVRCLHTEALQTTAPLSDDGINWQQSDLSGKGRSSGTQETWTEEAENILAGQRDGAENALTKTALGQTYTVQESRLFNLNLPQVNIRSSIETLKLARGLGLPEDELILDPYSRTPPKRKSQSGQAEPKELAPGIRMRLAYLEKTSLPHMKEIAAKRAKLPIIAHDPVEGKKSLIDTINSSDVTVVLAKTVSLSTPLKLHIPIYAYPPLPFVRIHRPDHVRALEKQLKYLNLFSKMVFLRTKDRRHAFSVPSHGGSQQLPRPVALLMSEVKPLASQLATRFATRSNFQTHTGPSPCVLQVFSCIAC